MKAIKIYLSIVTVLLVIAIGAGIYVWYLIQKLDTAGGSPDAFVATSTVSKNVQGETTKSAGEDTGPTTSTLATSPTTNTTKTQEPIVVDIDTLGSSQKKILESLGYGSEGSLTITPAMITCAEDGMGKDRLNEIVNGSAPTPLESLKLLPCFKL